VLQLLSARATGVVISRLFILGHDVCPQSFTPHRGLNRWIGRLAFLPSLTPCSLMVSVFAAVRMSGLVVAASATRQSVAWLLAVGFALPFLVWNGMIGFVVSVHHTHPQIA
jgi:hypothetical protein